MIVDLNGLERYGEQGKDFRVIAMAGDTYSSQLVECTVQEGKVLILLEDKSGTKERFLF